MNRNLISTGVILAISAALAACGGGEESEDEYSIAGSVSGLTGSGLVLQNNGSTVPVSAGSTQTTIASAVSAGTAYSVTIQTQPAGQTCAVANGSGTVSANVSNIAITCTTVPAATYTVNGSITGYTGTGLALRLNGQTGAAFNASPASGAITFGFTAALATGTPYAVTVVAQPTGPTQRCVANSGSGTIGAANVSSVAIVCTDGAEYTVGGPVTGLTGDGLNLVLGHTGAATQEVLGVPAGASSYVFASIVPAGGIFVAGIQTQPAGQACVITRGRGSSNAAVTDVPVACATRAGDPLSGVFTFLTPDGRQYLAFNADGTFTAALMHNDSDCNLNGDTRNGNGVEYGIFSWTRATGDFALTIPQVVDSTGDCGVGNPADFAGGYDGTMRRVGNTLVLESPGEDPLVATAIVGANPATSPVGAYISEGNNGVVLVLHDDNTFMLAETQARVAAGLGQERGCYLATATEITFTVGGNCRPDGLDSYDLNAGLGVGVFNAARTSIGPVPLTIENAGTIVIGPSRYRRILPN